MPSLTRALIPLLCLVLGGCVNTDRTTFLNYGDSTGNRQALMTAPSISDGLAVNYANSMQIVMRCNSTNSRITREVSATAQIGLAAFGGAGAALNYSRTAITVLGLGSAGIPQLQKLFDAKNRADVYNQAADMIQDGVFEYYENNPSPSPTLFTPNGLTLVKRVSSAISLVDGALVGHIPTVRQMQHAVESMSPRGTRKQVVGEPPVNALKTGVQGTPRLDRDPGAPTAISTAIPADVSSDRRRLTEWFGTQVGAKDFVRLRKFAHDMSLPDNLTDDQLTDSIRGLIRNATTRELVDPLLQSAGLSPGPASDSQPPKTTKPPVQGTKPQ